MQEIRQSAQKEKTRPLHYCYRRVPVLPVLLLSGILCTAPAGARSLDKEVEFILLTQQCNQIMPTGNLANICSALSGGGGTSGGGNAAASVTSPGIIQERLLAARGENEDTANGTTQTVALSSGMNIFFAGEYESQDRDITAFEDGFDSDIGRFTVGGDYRFTDKLVAGAALTYYNQTGDFDGGGDFDNDSYGVTGFASLQPIDQAFIQATVGYAAKDYDRTRIATFVQNGIAVTPTVPGAVNGDYDGDELSAGLLAGYDFSFGSLTIGPRVGLDYIKTDFDGYSETGSTGLELVFAGADKTSVQSRVGIAASQAISTGFGVLLPQASVNWVHEFEDDQRSEAFSFVEDGSKTTFFYDTEGPDKDFFEFSVGVAAVLPNGWLPYAQFRTTVDHDYLDSAVAAVGLRKEF
jgi:uncharacterized protein YhjY with autotransporter beta-barrel domain